MRVLVAGAGVLGQSVVDALVGRRHDVIVVDSDPRVCDRVYAEFGVVTVHGSASDLHVLRSAGTADADVLIALMHSDSDNVACALLARSLGVGQVIARMRDDGYEESYRNAGVTHLVRVTDVVRNQILAQVEHPQVQELLGFGDTRVRIFSVAVSDEALSVGRSVVELAQHPRFPKACLLLGVFRTGTESLIITRGSDRIEAGDTALLITAEADIDDAVHVLTSTAE